MCWGKEQPLAREGSPINTSVPSVTLPEAVIKNWINTSKNITGNCNAPPATSSSRHPVLSNYTNTFRCVRWLFHSGVSWNITSFCINLGNNLSAKWNTAHIILHILMWYMSVIDKRYYRQHLRKHSQNLHFSVSSAKHGLFTICSWKGTMTKRMCWFFCVLCSFRDIKCDPSDCKYYMFSYEMQHNKETFSTQQSKI